MYIAMYSVSDCADVASEGDKVKNAAPSFYLHEKDPLKTSLSCRVACCQMELNAFDKLNLQG